MQKKEGLKKRKLKIFTSSPKLGQTKEAMALSQIIVLILGTIAISYAIGSSIPRVSASNSFTLDVDYEDRFGGDNPFGSPGLFGGTSFQQTYSQAQHRALLSSIPEPAAPPSPTDYWKKANEKGLQISSSGSGDGVTGGTGTGNNQENNPPSTGGDGLTGTAVGNWMLKHGFGEGISNALGNVVQGAQYLSYALGIIELAGSLGMDPATKLALQRAAIWGIMSGKTLFGLTKQGGFLNKAIFGADNKLLGFSPGTVSAVVGIGIAVYVFLKYYKKTEEQRISFTCEDWQAPLGGKFCEECNKGILPCTPYQCEALGQGCEMINEGTEEAMCVWANIDDVTPPVMDVWEEALPSDKYDYKPETQISPPNRGYFIRYDSKVGCIPPYTAFSFGLKTVGGGVKDKFGKTQPEPSICKIDIERDKTFDEMEWYFGGSASAKYNHSHVMSLPSKEALEAENLTVDNNGNYALYVRCIDSNGNPKPDSPSASIVFKYCIDQGPDLTPPQILGTNLPSDEPVGYDVENFDLELYVNEPSDCRWSRDRDMAFELMEGRMEGPDSVYGMNTNTLYTYTTTLTSIQNRQDNVFYFRCKDNPKLEDKDRNVNEQGYRYNIIGTQPLVIVNAGPNETMRGSTETVEITLEVETTAGYQDGIATCWYSESCYKPSGSKEIFADIIGETMYTSNLHSENIWIPAGQYQCMIKCLDRGGNEDKVEINYAVEVDKAYPVIVRAYKSPSSDTLEIITNEEGVCRYSETSCVWSNFEDGILMSTYDGLVHFTDWGTDSIYYIKCKDIYGNQPNPDKCQLQVQGFEIFESQ